MKKIKKSIISMFMAFVLMFSFLLPIGQVNTKKASALSPDYMPVETMPTVYYFSDSQPTFKDYLDQQIGLNVIYDTQYFITSQELAFMLYTGYFWGFNQESTNIVIIEIKAIKPDYFILNELFECLQYQGCKVMFISPYQPEFVSGEVLEYVDASMPCNQDLYMRFIKNSIRSMLNTDGCFLDNTTILLDGRFIKRNGLSATADFSEVCAESMVYKRLLLYITYNADSYAEPEFEDELYQGLWGSFQQSTGTTLDYFEEDTEISAYYGFWEGSADSIEGYFQQYYEGHYLAQVRLYYGQMIEDLYSRNIHILTHIGGTQYIDILEMNNASINDIWEMRSYAISVSSYYTTLFGAEAPFLIEYLYAIGIWYLQEEYYDLTYSIASNITDIYNEFGVDLTGFAVYIWEEDPFVDAGEGLPVVREGDLHEEYGTNACNSCNNCADCLEYEQSYLENLFEDLFTDLFYNM